MELSVDKEIRDLLKKVIAKELGIRLDGSLTEEDKIRLESKRKSLIELLNDADKNSIEAEKVEAEKDRNEIEREKLILEREKMELEAEIEQAKINSDREAAKERARYDFLGKVATGALTLVGTIAGLIFLNRWTKWGFIQEEFGSIAGKTMNNVMREWRIKRA